MATEQSESVGKFFVLVQELSTALASLKRFEGTFVPEAKKLYTSSLEALEHANSVVTANGTPSSGIVGYLLPAGSSDVKAAQAQLLQCLSAIVSGGVPVPRSAKEDLSNLRTSLQSLKIQGPAAPPLKEQLRTLYRDITRDGANVDVLETKLDEVVRQILAKLYNGTTVLPETDLHRELESIKNTISQLQSSTQTGQEDDVALLSLILNSVERMHGVRIAGEDSEEEEEAAEEEGDLDDEDDDDDPFFMPLPSALKLADASKFSELAEPIKEAEMPFMIAMEPEDASSAPGPDGPSASGAGTAQESPVLTDQDFVPVTEEEQTQGAKAAADAAAAGMAALSIPSPKDGPSGAASPTPDTAGAGEDAAASAGAAAGTAAASINSPHPTDEKLNMFVDFLHGDNPGACQFHAQMRLSHEGCRKLANFIQNSGRVRALSLSHNLIGDEGLRILCVGLRTNKSVTALDLPDNDISDHGAKELAMALTQNTSLTQLQLAYNKIGNEGAEALSQLISKSQSLKKLGLSHNQIGKAGCQALTGAISANQSLNHLQLLPGNPVEEKDAKALAKALKRNKKFSIRSFLAPLTSH